MNWKIGDRAILLYTPGGKQIGSTTEILSQLRPADNDTKSGEIKAGDMVYEIDAASDNGSPICISRPEWLGKIPPEKKTSWSEVEKDCLWNPTKEVCHVDIGSG